MLHLQFEKKMCLCLSGGRTADNTIKGLLRTEASYVVVVVRNLPVNTILS
jgi:6-phosphogluconolactonase/glucosamine-6-phosphate isomerase/deaminase